MSEIKWIKMATDIFDNRKIRQIECMPEGDAIIVIWIKLLCLAGNTNDSGFIYLTDEIPYTEQMLATQFNRPLSTIQLALRTFEQFGMIDIVDDLLKISNWEKYQNIEGMERVREQTRNRVAKCREKKKLLECNVTCNATVTQSNALDIDKDIDINNICASDDAPKPKSYTEEPEYQDFLKIYELYPKKKGKQSAYTIYKKWIKGTKTIDGKKYKLDNKQIWFAVDNYVEDKKKSNTQIEYYCNFDTLMNRLLDWVVEESEV